MLNAGTLDPTFGTGGEVLTAFPGYRNIQANSMAVQSDGKIVVAGTSVPLGIDVISAVWDVLRYTTAGALDTTFGTGGEVGSPFAGSANSVAVQSDGKIVVAGRGRKPLDFLLVRYNTDGTLDTTFGTGGGVITAFHGSTSGYYNYANSVAVQSDGKIVVVGQSLSLLSGTSDFAVARYTTAGALDTTFGNNGEVLTAFNGSASNGANSVAVQSDGKIVVAGSSSQSSGQDFAVARYNTDGTLDKTTFGNNGEVLTAFNGSTSNTANSVAVQSDGKIVVAGTSGGNSFAVARYTTAGALDTTFGTGGEVLGPGGSAKSVVVQSDGKIVVAGTSGSDFAVARYTGDLATKAGPYSVTASVAGVSTPASFSLTNKLGAPTTTTALAQPASSTPTTGTAGPTVAPGGDPTLAPVLARPLSDSTGFIPAAVPVSLADAPSPAAASGVTSPALPLAQVLLFGPSLIGTLPPAGPATDSPPPARASTSAADQVFASLGAELSSALFGDDLALAGGVPLA
jgi:uncharacterized delta-60 repeat protein